MNFKYEIKNEKHKINANQVKSARLAFIYFIKEYNYKLNCM